MATKTGNRTIVILVPQGAQMIDVAGPADVFAEANFQLGTDAYSVVTVATGHRTIKTSSGLELIANHTIADQLKQKIHTLLVAGAPGMADLRPSSRVLEWLRTECPRARRYGSICSGTFLLAAAGLLDGRQVTTHWNVADILARSFPSLSVVKDALYCRDGRVRTAAGVTAGMDLSLSLIEEDHGRDLALKVSGQLVMFFKRPGGQLQFSRQGLSAPTCRSILQELLRWVASQPAEDLSVPRLAERTGLSIRHFSRLFRSEIGVTPAVWVESARVQAARRMLESSESSPKQVAVQCGFSNVDVFRRNFRRLVGVTPSEYQKRFTQDASDSS